MNRLEGLEQARDLVDRISAYWREKGYRGLIIWIDEHQLKPTEKQAVSRICGKTICTLFEVRSNMVNGYPPKCVE